MSHSLLTFWQFFYHLVCSVKISFVISPLFYLFYSDIVLVKHTISAEWYCLGNCKIPCSSSRTGDRWFWAEFLSWLNLVFCEQSVADRWLWPEFALNILWVCDVQITLAISYCLKKREGACHFCVICLHYPDTYSPQCCCRLWETGPIG